jgi:hypothetical protein
VAHDKRVLVESIRLRARYESGNGSTVLRQSG